MATPIVTYFNTLDWKQDPDNADGRVAEVPNRETLEHYKKAFKLHGYEVSDSRDDEGRLYIWISTQDARFIMCRAIEESIFNKLSNAKREEEEEALRELSDAES